MRESGRSHRRPLRTDTAGLLRLVGPAWLVVDVGLPPGLRDRVHELAGHLDVLVVTEEPAPRQGRVTLVAAGPGPTSLLTLEACAALRGADVVFFDRPASTAELDGLTGGAELVDVGATLFCDELVTRARGGESVVRLRAGDPFVFGRGGEELRACVEAGIPVRVVAGLSTALSVPASCGIPVAHRDVTATFTVICGHTPPTADESAALVTLGGTLVVLMGVAGLPQTLAALTRAGLAGRTPVAVIERGFAPTQRNTLTTVARLAADLRHLGLTAPAVVVIGDVVAVAPSFGASAEHDRARAS